MTGLVECMERSHKVPAYWTQLTVVFSTVTYEEIPHMHYIPSISWFKRDHCLGESSTATSDISAAKIPCSETRIHEFIVDRTRQALPKAAYFTSTPITSILPGVGGFGSVYCCEFADGSIVGVKLVARERISKLDHIICGKILGSVIAFPLLLLTHAFFSTDQCHVYVTEFLTGIDLAKVDCTAGSLNGIVAVWQCIRSKLNLR